MKSTRLLWGTISIGALASTLLLFFGLAYAVNDIINPQASDLTSIPEFSKNRDDLVKDNGQIDIVALGDSLTKGTGDRTGAGYIGRVKDKLSEATGRDVHVINNLAVNGYRTDQMLSDLEKPSVADTLSKADVIIFTIGGNDLFKYVRNELDLTSAEITGEDLMKSIPEPMERLDQIFKKLNDINPSAVIVYVGLFNPFLDLDPTRQTSLAIAEWNAKAYTHVNGYENVIMVPTADLFERHLLDYLYSDHFHPNDAGYERVAERVVQALY